MAWRRVWLAVVAVVLAGCGGHPAVVGVARPAYGGPPADACSLLTTAEVEQVLGGPATAVSGAIDVNHPDDRTCRWRAPGAIVSVYYNGSAADSRLLEARLADPDFEPGSRVAVGDGAVDSVLGLQVLVGDAGLIVNGPRPARAELARLVVRRLG